MKLPTLMVSACALILLLAGCSAASRRQALTLFFDGVPPPKASPAGAEAPSADTGVAPTRQVQYTEHGPFAAKLCNACHEPGATNVLVAPKDELCSRCHVVDLSRPFVHGPLASGGCLVCHEPHSSRYRHLLVSESDSFCLRCHEPEGVARIDGHGDLKQDCTGCHDAHGSDQRYMLR